MNENGNLTPERAYHYCELVVKKKAKNFYYSFLFLPKDKRFSIYAIYAFCHSCDAIADGTLSQNLKLKMLTEYREILQTLEKGGTTDDAMFFALKDTQERFDIPPNLFLDLIDGVMMDLGINRYDTFEELRVYAYKVASVVGLMLIKVFGYTDPAAEEHAVNFGIAMQMVNILRDLKEDAHHDRIYLPREDLKRFGYTEKELLRGENNKAFRELMTFQIARAREFFDRGLKLLPLLDRRSRYCPRMLAVLYLAVLDKIEARHGDVFTKRVALRPGRKRSLAITTFIKNTFLP